MFYFFLLLFLSNEAFGIRPRIIGGNTASIHQFPFAAAIEVQTSNGRYFCGGTLYTNQYILTAGQCVDQATSFTISLGTASLSDPKSVIVSSSEYILHPDYDYLTLANDIGLIKLRMPIQFTDSIKSAILPSAALPQAKQVRAIGWGQTSDDDPELSDVLQTTFVIPLSNNECKEVYGSQVTDSMVCVEGNYNQGACHGDTGSPLVETESRYVEVIAGISSFVSFNGCESTDPSGYTRVFNYVNWIQEVTTS